MPIPSTTEAHQYADRIRRVQWEHFDGRISVEEREQRIERIWDRVYDHGGRAFVSEVEQALEAQKTVTASCR